MEHSKLVAFSIKCNKCSRAWSLSLEDFKTQNIICPECKSEFTVYEGIKNGLKAEQHIFPNTFLANDIYQEVIEIKIGYSTDIHLPPNIKKIFRVNVFPQGPFVAGAADITTSGFKIFTSLQADATEECFGTPSNLLLIVNAKTDDYDDPWLHFLSYAYDHYQSGEYITSIIMSEIAFEAYVDKTLTNAYEKIGMDSNSISRFITAIEMPDKVNPLMNNLYGVKLSSCSSWTDWEKRVLKWRNYIAHGTKKSASKEEAKLAYDTVVDSIFYFFEAVDRKENLPKNP